MNEEKSDISHLLDEDAFAQAYSEALDFKSSLEAQNLSAELQDLDERYKVKDLLGEGAVKKVYLAFDKLMDRNVALAKIKDNNLDLIDDFLREARLSSTLEHPYISPVYDMGFSDDGLPFFVMKLYDGRNLHEELLTRNKRGIRKNENITWVLDVFLKVCEAVSFAHTKNVLHLDIKPSNIRINDHGEVLLCDWGIARLISKESLPDSLEELEPSSVISRSTLLGEVRGTPGFMAPEQFLRNAPCNEKTDVFGLGALLEDMISGDPPGSGLSLDEVFCPVEIAAICKKAVSKNPADRYETVQALIDDINKYKSGMVTSAEDADSFLIIRKWALRHKAAVAIAVFNILLISTFLYVYVSDIRDSKSNLETVVDMLKVEREEQQQARLKLAKKYYDQGYELYCNAVSSFDFDARDILQSSEIIQRSLDLNSEDQDTWGMSGRLHLIQGLYEQAESDFSKGGSNYARHYEVLKEFNQRSLSPGYEKILELIGAINVLRDNRLRNHIIFKGIHTYKTGALLNFSIGSIKVICGIDDLKWSFDRENQTLDLSGNPGLKVVYPLKTLRFPRLNLSRTALSSHELHNLRRIPLKYLDASYTPVKSLNRLANEELLELNLEGSKITDLSGLRNLNVEELNIAGTNADLGSLKGCRSLKKVICSQSQMAKLRELLGTSVELQPID